MSPRPSVSQEAHAPSSRSDAPLIRIGARLRFLGEPWTVVRILHSARGIFFSIDADSGAHDCIAADGSDGGYELLEQLPPVTARDSDQGQSGSSSPMSKATGLAETPAPSPAREIANPIPDRFAPRKWRP